MISEFPASLTQKKTYRLLKRKKIAVLMGGRSAEREVSFRSGRGALAALRRLGLAPVALDAAFNLEKKLVSEGIDLAFIALHGRWGEDGIVQGLLEYLNIGYTGSGVHASALANDKVSAKQIFRANRIPTPPFFLLKKGDHLSGLFRAVAKIGFPLILKPPDEGSSIGCYLIKAKRELLPGLKKAWRKYPKIMVEKYVRGKEVTVGLLEVDGNLREFPVLELQPRMPFYDYKAKYQKGMTEFICPAQIPPSTVRRLMALTRKTHRMLNCHGYSRTDFILDRKTGKPQVLELNTLPGLTSLSDLPAQAKAAGMPYDQLIFHIMASSLTARRSQRRAVYYD